ncbi:MAG TPA: adenylate/guanylate cyclase domain-containing protein [Alphaproteobacteria bacterium]|nr:adenylate/guanylate cyclase domain-containing protein [Alphaproteobacteria bacterium]
MKDAALLKLSEWITEAGLAGLSELALVQEFCRRAVEAGVPLSRGLVGVDTLHPVLEGRVFAWRRNESEVRQSDYTRADGESEKWLRSPFYHLVQTGETMLRRRLDAHYNGGEFPILDELRDQGTTDYVAMVNRFGADARIGEVDSIFSSWSSDGPDGFSDRDLAALRLLIPHLALAVKSASFARIAETLVDTYLGRDAGRRVLGGHITRGVADKINAVLWFSDLEGYTRIADAAAPEQVIPLLNDYADALVTAIHGQGGDVLKFIGDGLLAVFSKGSFDETCLRALAAEAEARRRVAELNARRSADGLPTTQFYLGLHVGEVFYGNIGSVDRLDFTVVGPAVNETSRIAAMCRSLDQPVLLSSAFADAAPECRAQLVSVGRYALRGVARPQELYTVDPEARG